MGYYNTFIVRIWTDDGLRPSRGHIEHVGTSDRIWFTYLEQMSVFISDHLRSPSGPSRRMDEGAAERQVTSENTEEGGS